MAFRKESIISVAMMVVLSITTSSLTSALVVPSIELPPSATRPYHTTGESTTSVDAAADTTVTTASWRVALNLGRESSTPLLDSYGVSGIRFPVVVPCDFISLQSDDGKTSNLVEPQSDTVSYIADVHGGVSKPVRGGEFQWSPDQKKLEFTLEFPEELQKKDVRIPAGSTLVLEGQLYSQAELKQMEQAFSQARIEEWKALEQVEEIQKIRNAPKKWNPETQKWEYHKVDEPLVSLFSKHYQAFVKAQARRQRFREKPRSGIDMSDRPGRFPGFAKDNLVYFGTQGVIRNQSKGGMVVGTWSAEPIVA